MFSNYPKFRKRAATALREILDWPEDSGDPIMLFPAEDGSSIGSALSLRSQLRDHQL